MYGKHGGPLDEWTLESRWRYALVWGGLNVLVVGGLIALFSSLDGKDLLVAALAPLVISLAAQAFIWYPRAKQKAASSNRVTGDPLAG